jgi:diacylglycerol kinase
MTRRERQQAKTFAKDIAGFAVFAMLILQAPVIIRELANVTALIMGVK